MILGIVLLTVAIGALVLVGVLVATSTAEDPVANRVRAIRDSARNAQLVYSSAGLVVTPTMPSQAQVEVARRARSESPKPTLRDRLVQAGLYRAYSPATFAVVRVLLAVIPLGVGVAAGVLGVTSMMVGCAAGALAAAIGTLSPTFWLDYMKSNRQKQLRRSLPDALDVIVVCLEGGLSLTGAFTRVAQELGTVHVLLAAELRIVQREVQMGRTTGEALRNLAMRFDLEELRSLAAVISQAERFGTSVVKALTVYAETMRIRRHQRAEELAHQATVKMIFPTLLCIFPAIFVVLLGPAVVRIYHAFQGGGG